MSRRIYTEIVNPNGNFLFTVDELNAADSRTKCLPCKCLHCGKIFYISKHEYQVALLKRSDKSSSYKFCSQKCHNNYHRNRQVLKCDFCGKTIVRTPAQISPHNFCSQSCAAKFNNKGRIPTEETREKRSKTLLNYYEHVKTEKLQHPKTKFKSGHHTSWEGKLFYYRSSYELDYCNLLDTLKISYEMESLRIRYFNTRKNREAIAIPDFYLKDLNTIVEVKSLFTYNPQDMKDRVKAYKRLGYNFKLILEHKEYKDCPENLNMTTIDNY